MAVLDKWSPGKRKKALDAIEDVEAEVRGLFGPLLTIISPRYIIHGLCLQGTERPSESALPCTASCSLPDSCFVGIGPNATHAWSAEIV